jgi:hypothetical protein
VRAPKKTFVTLAVLLVVLFFIPAGLRAGTITTDGTYYEFFFGAAPSAAAGCSPCMATTNPVAVTSVGPPWTFSDAASLFVLDIADTGDQFQAFDNGISLGTTSVVPNPGTDPCGFNIGCAAGNPLYTKRTFALGIGAHSITLNVIQNATDRPTPCFRRGMPCFQ